MVQMYFITPTDWNFKRADLIIKIIGDKIAGNQPQTKKDWYFQRDESNNNRQGDFF